MSEYKEQVKRRQQSRCPQYILYISFILFETTISVDNVKSEEAR